MSPLGDGTGDPPVQSPGGGGPWEGARPGELFRAVYTELHDIARHSMRGQPVGHTLQPTALVNEAYLRMRGSEEWQDRSHFLRVAARAMRQILVDHSRRRAAEKRVPPEKRQDYDQSIDGLAAQYDARSIDLVGLDAALGRLAERDPKLAELVELHFFGGQTMEECARLLGLSERQAYRWWKTARAFLHREVEGG